jgi:hypothetical protein
VGIPEHAAFATASVKLTRTRARILIMYVSSRIERERMLGNPLHPVNALDVKIP